MSTYVMNASFVSKIDEQTDIKLRPGKKTLQRENSSRNGNALTIQ